MVSPPKFHPLEAALLAALFATGIVLPFVKQRVLGDADTSNMENRYLAQAPAVPGGLRSQVNFFPVKFDAWYADHFGFRALLLETGALLKVEGFGMSDNAVVGKDGWLFLKMDPPLYKQSLDTNLLEAWKNYLEFRQKWLAARGVKYLFVVPPDKETVYPEFLPSYAGAPPAELPVDRLVRYLKETHSPVDVLSLRQAELTGKTAETQILYYKQDTHWNNLGAFYGYQEIIRHLAPEIPGLQAMPRAAYSLAIVKDTRRDIADETGLPRFATAGGPFLQPIVPEAGDAPPLPVPKDADYPVTIQNPAAGNLPRAVTLCDSFSRSLAPYFERSFSRVTYFWPLETKGNVEQKMRNAVIHEKPAVFIEERIQRFIPGAPRASVLFDENGDGGEGIH